MPVKKYKPTNFPRIREKAVQDRDARIREAIESSKARITTSKRLVQVSRELVAEFKQLKKGFL